MPFSFFLINEVACYPTFYIDISPQFWLQKAFIEDVNSYKSGLNIGMHLDTVSGAADFLVVFYNTKVGVTGRRKSNFTCFSFLFCPFWVEKMCASEDMERKILLYFWHI